MIAFKRRVLCHSPSRFAVAAAHFCLPAVVALAAVWQPAAAEETRPAERLTIHPSPEARPSLRYRLLPEDCVQANAAPLYLRACLIWTENPERTTAQETDLVEACLNHEADGFPIAKARKTLDRSRMALELVQIAARRDRCNWELPIEGGNLFEMPLPEPQTIRRLAHLVALEARWHMVEGRFDEALESLQTGFALARHMGQDGTLVHALVGIVVAEQMIRQLQFWVQMPKSPNLSWALTALPQPLVEIEPALAFERMAIRSTLPQVARFEREKLTEEEARRLVAQMRAALQRMGINQAALDKALPATAPGQDAVQTAIKRYTQEFGQRVTELDVEIASLAPTQIIALTEFERFRVLWDGDWKWVSVPYWQVEEAANGRAASLTRDSLPIFAEILPVVLPARRAQVRLERRLAALRYVEAIRLDAANHGRLPAQLSDITAVPVPSDPVTGKAFGYSVSGDRAVLKSGSIPHQGPLEFELRLAP